MLEIFKKLESDHILIKNDRFEKGCWVNLIAPTEDELNKIEAELVIHSDFLRDPLDEEETPRIDIDENQTLIIVDIPNAYQEGKSLRIETVPMGIVITENFIITICLKESPIIDDFKENRIKEFYTFKRTRFTYQILLHVAKDFLRYLKHINKKTNDMEKFLQRSMRNRELFRLLEMEKSLVFFSTSLKANEIMMEKLAKGKHLKMYEEDQDLLEDVLIENRQAIEMTGIYSSILSGTMGTFASVISNNLNMVMKLLASITIVMAIPTMIASFFGMNVPMPFKENDPFAFVYILGFSVIVSLAAIYVLSKKGMF
ncbi:MAG: magnesium transporter [Clostridiales bacterium]|jgi:magnesium transporter|nr:magnesium transporter [Clostridiales bacterium]